MVDQQILVLLVGVIAGLVRAGLGYLNRPDGEPFKLKPFLRSVIVSIIAGAYFAFQLDSGNGGTLTSYVATFFSAIGADLLLKEVYDL